VQNSNQIYVSLAISGKKINDIIRNFLLLMSIIFNIS